MEKLLKNLYSVSDKHKQLDIHNMYKSQPLHIALEKADLRKDWETFRKLFSVAPDILKTHIDLTSDVFNWNFKALAVSQRNRLFE